MKPITELRRELCEASFEMENRYRMLRDTLINIAALTRGTAHELAIEALNETGALQEANVEQQEPRP